MAQDLSNIKTSYIDRVSKSSNNILANLISLLESSKLKRCQDVPSDGGEAECLRMQISAEQILVECNRLLSIIQDLKYHTLLNDQRDILREQSENKFKQEIETTSQVNETYEQLLSLEQQLSNTLIKLNSA